MSWIGSRDLLIRVIAHERACRDSEKGYSHSCEGPVTFTVVCHRLSWVLDVWELSERLLLPSLPQRLATRQRIRNSCVEQCRNLQHGGYGSLSETPAHPPGAGASNLNGALGFRRARFQHYSRAPRRTAPDQHDKKDNPFRNNHCVVDDASSQERERLTFPLVPANKHD